MEKREGNQVTVIAVYGSSCTGKSTLVNHIVEHSEIKPTIVSQDSYYYSGSKDTNFDVPESIDFPLLVSHLKSLIKGETVESPVYCFKKHRRLEETKTLKPSKVIIVEGTLILTQQAVRELCTIKVYISAFPELLFSRRLKRDVEERGRTIDEVTTRYLRDVVNSNIFHVEPSQNHADIVLKNNIEGKFIGLNILLAYLHTLHI